MQHGTIKLKLQCDCLLAVYFLQIMVCFRQISGECFVLTVNESFSIIFF
jgi:hypothetical protein